MMASRYPTRGQRLAELGHIKAQSLLVSSTETINPQTSNITGEPAAEPSGRFTEPSTSDDYISVTKVKETSSTLQITTSASDHTNMLTSESDNTSSEEEFYESSGDEYKPNDKNTVSSDGEISSEGDEHLSVLDEQLNIGDLPSPKKRSKKADVSKWIRHRNKMKRMKGQAYDGLKKDMQSNRYQQNIKKSARKLGPRCSSQLCQKSSKRACGEISDITRQELFISFWNDMDWGQRKTYIASLVHVKGKPRSRLRRNNVSTPSRRSNTLQYRLKIDNNFKPFFQRMFINTLGVKACMVQDWVKVKHGIHKSPSTTKQPTKKKIDDVDQRQNVTDFLQNLPKMPPHYCRASTEKQYLESIIPSKSELYRVYTQWCLDNQKTQASRWLLMNVFSEINISFFQPKRSV